MNIFLNKSISLGLSVILRFLIALEISRKLSTETASIVFIVIAIVQLLTITERGRLSAAKTRFVERVITQRQFNYIHQSTFKFILISGFVLFLILIIGSLIIDTNLYAVTLGYIIGILFLFNSRNQLANEVQKTSVVYYWILNSYNIFLYIMIKYFYESLSILIFLSTLILVFDILFNHRNGDKINLEIIQSSKFKRIEVFTVVIAAVELPLIFVLGGTSNVVAYAILSRLYGSVPPVYGQLSRPIWASGEFVELSFKNKVFSVNLNKIMLFFFLVVIMSLPVVDIAFIRSEADVVMIITFVFFAALQVCNRFYKNKYLHNSVYESVATRILKYYVGYVVALIIILFFSFSIEIFLVCKVLLAAAVFYENVNGGGKS